MLNIRLSDLAIKKLDDLLDYLEEKWSENVAFAFEETFADKINQILKFPEKLHAIKAFL